MSGIVSGEIKIDLDWVRVSDGTKAADCHTKGHKLSNRVRAQFKGPRVYRWVIYDTQKQIMALYIGETGKFEQRLALYRNGHKKPKDTVNYIRNCFEQASANGQMIELQLLVFDPFTINGARVEMSRLSDPAIRKLLENTAILEAKAKKLKILNRDEDTNVKTLRRLLQKMPGVDPVAVIEEINQRKSYE